MVLAASLVTGGLDIGKKNFHGLVTFYLQLLNCITMNSNGVGPLSGFEVLDFQIAMYCQSLRRSF